MSFRPARGRSALLAAMLLIMAIAAAPAAAQFSSTPASQLTVYMRLLAANPRDVNALLGAGRAALALGDTDAAIGFFARAGQINPRDVRAPAALGSALLTLQQPRQALRYFAQARALGANEGDLARDRGLANDLVGNHLAAQRDYQTVLRLRADAEVQRRLALSLAMSGDRTGALLAIRDQLSRREPAAQRARVFVLALTGDQRGASAAVDAALAPREAGVMKGYLLRLPELSAEQRAAAVHLGVFPRNVRPAPPVVFADATPAAAPAPTRREGGRAARRAAARREQPRRASPAAPHEPAPARLALVDRAARAVAEVRALPRAPQLASLRAAPPIRLPALRPSIVTDAELIAAIDAGRTAPGSPPVAARSASSIAATPVIAAPVPSTAPSGAASTTVAPVLAAPIATAPLPAPQQTAAAAPSSAAAPATQQPTLPIPEAQVAAAPAPVVVPVPDGTPATQDAAAGTTAAPPVMPQQDAERLAAAVDEFFARNPLRPAPAPPLVAAAEPAVAQPARQWVQVGIGADRGLFPADLRRLRARAPELFGDRAGWSARMGATNRLLVGPFASATEARDFVNRLKAAGVDALPFQSREGEEVARLAAR